MERIFRAHPAFSNVIVETDNDPGQVDVTFSVTTDKDNAEALAEELLDDANSASGFWVS